MIFIKVALLKKIEWMEVFCGEKSKEVYGEDVWLPDETLDSIH